MAEWSLKISAAAMICAVALAGGTLERAATAQGLFQNDNDAPKAEARLVAGWTESDGKRVAGLRVDLADGWKTYWRSPGEGGIPPSFDWEGSENLADVEIDWPTPIVFDTYGMRTIGYRDEMVLPLRITPKDDTRPVRLKLALFYGLCEEICVPARADISLDLPADPHIHEAESIRAALAAAPLPASHAGLTQAKCAFREGEFTARLSFASRPEQPPVVVIEGQKGLWFSPLESHVDAQDIVARGEMRAKPGEWIDRSALRLTLLSENGGPAFTLQGCPG